MAAAYASRIFYFSACFCLLAGGQAAQARRRMPPGAFLHHPARSLKSLNRQIQNDPLVTQRYARIYRLSPEMVKVAFANMHLGVLTEDHIYEIHYVHPGEKIGYKVRRVRKGTAVYRMPDGTPALVKVCGNPIRAKQPTAVRGAFLRAPEFAQPETALDFQPYEALEAPANAAPVVVNNVRDAEPFAGFIESPAIPGPTEIPITPIELPAAAIPATAVHAVSSFANAVPAILAPLGALAGLLASSGGSGGSPIPGGAVIPPSGGGTPPIIVIPPVVIRPGATSTPEPSAAIMGAAMLSAGFAGMRFRRRIRKRS